MPWRPKHPCAYPGCPKLTYERFCEVHKKLDARNYEKYGRSEECKKRYGTAWRKIRRRYIMSHPLCEMCEQEGRLTKANEVHHVIPLSKGGTHEESNLMSLCKSCHSKITAKTGDRWHNRKRDVSF